MDKKISEFQNGLKYKSARTSLLILIIFSAVNLFSLTFGGFYFLFSSYITQIFAILGYEAAYLNDTVGVALFIALGLVSVLPYVLCYIFSKKKIGWMIGALVLFSIDTLILAYDIVTVIMGDAKYISEYIWDIFFHAYALYALISCVVYGVKLKNSQSDESEELGSSPLVSDGLINEARRITVTKKKETYGWALECLCCIDGNNVGTVKNGETKEFYIDENVHTLVIVTSAGVSTEPVTIPSDLGDKAYEVKFKFNFFKGATPTITQL